MAKTTFASRIATLRQRAESEHKRSESNLAVWIGALYELLGVRRISRIQISWCRNRVIAIRDKYPDDLRVQKMLEDLDRRADEAWSRHLARIKKREEARSEKEQEKASRRGMIGRPPKISTTEPVSVPANPGQSPTSLWEELLKQQQEKDRGT